LPRTVLSKGWLRGITIVKPLAVSHTVVGVTTSQNTYSITLEIGC
jgi:hypothetical protein